MTNIVSLSLLYHYAFVQKTSVGTRPCNNAKRLIGCPQEALLCAKAKRQQLFYLCESVATATTKRPVGTAINHTLW
ncbi:hypothetical protein [Lysinibacillus sp. NPDC056232]|uniref:hypothetical protein n=1 Tax=Lysinibacillus sp. NPDC056232 TaxID=3345756 RepID=UPI0035E2D3FA